MPDERAVMTCISSYYHTFAGAQKVFTTLKYLIYHAFRSLEITHAIRLYRKVEVTVISNGDARCHVVRFRRAIIGSEISYECMGTLDKELLLRALL